MKKQYWFIILFVVIGAYWLGSWQGSHPVITGQDVSSNISDCKTLTEFFEKDVQPLSPTDFGKKFTDYLIACETPLEKRMTAFTTIDFGKLLGQIDYKTVCSYNAKTNKIDCTAHTYTFAFDQNNKSGTLNCTENNTSCFFEYTNGSPADYSAPLKPQIFKTTWEGNHGLNCTPVNFEKDMNKTINKMNLIRTTPIPTQSPLYNNTYSCEEF